MYESNRARISGTENAALGNLDTRYREAVSVFPSLAKYQAEHNSDNLQKLCVEIADFCRAVYASTESDAERRIYNNMIAKLKR